MKKLSFLMALILGQWAWAANSTNQGLPLDRREVGPGLWGVVHTENYEYTCPIEFKDGGHIIDSTIWLDMDFSNDPKNRFRMAAAFPGNVTLHGLLGVEMPITMASQGRCLNLCLSITVQRDDSDPTLFEINESAGKISIKGINQRTKLIEIMGSCHKNEVP